MILYCILFCCYTSQHNNIIKVFIKLIINIISIGNDLANTFFDFYIIIFEYDFNSYPELGGDGTAKVWVTQNTKTHLNFSKLTILCYSWDNISCCTNIQLISFNILHVVLIVNIKICQLMKRVRTKTLWKKRTKMFQRCFDEFMQSNYLQASRLRQHLLSAKANIGKFTIKTILYSIVFR